MTLDPASSRIEAILSLLRQAQQHAAHYIGSVRDRPVFPTPGALQRLSELEEPLPEGPSAPHDILAQLHEVGSPATVAQTGGRYFGFVNGGTVPVGLAARWLADTWDQNAAHYVMSPIASRLEEICENWIVDLLGFPEGTAAGFVDGTTMANLSGMVAARNELLNRWGWDVVARGLHGAPPFRILAGQAVHASIYKAVSLLGLGMDSVEIVPSDDQGRMRADQIPDLNAPALVITQAGEVHTGAFDPVGDICDRVAESGSWVHVDGAFGLWAAALPRLRDPLAGIEKADSWSVDAHKTLNVPYDSGIVLCRHREALNNAFRATASYLQWTGHREGMQYTPSMSRRARGVELWAVLKTLGRSGVVDLIEGLCQKARLFARRLKEEGFEIHNDVVFTQVIASCEDDEGTNATLERLQSGGECWCGGSTWRGRAVIRISVCDLSTTDADVERSVAALVAARG